MVLSGGVGVRLRCYGSVRGRRQSLGGFNNESFNELISYRIP